MRFIGLMFMCVAAWGDISYPDFQMSMVRAVGEGRVKKYMSANKKIVKLFKDIYEKNEDSSECREGRIPKIIHQIWLGKEEMPKAYQEWMKTWAFLNGWEYRLWMDEDVQKLTLHNQDLYDRSQNYGEKSDILRLELLHRYGGLYVDLDYECLRPEIFEELNACYDLYMGFEPLEHGFLRKENSFKLCNALMASIPGHPLMKHLMVNLKANYLAYSPFAGPVGTTGPSYLTRIVIGYEQSGVDRYRNIYLPCTFFYPFSEPDLNTKKSNPFSIRPETAGIHYWGGSWREVPTLNQEGSSSYGGSND